MNTTLLPVPVPAPRTAGALTAPAELAATELAALTQLAAVTELAAITEFAAAAPRAEAEAELAAISQLAFLDPTYARREATRIELHRIAAQAVYVSDAETELRELRAVPAFSFRASLRAKLARARAAIA